MLGSVTMTLSHHFVDPSTELAVLAAIGENTDRYFQIADYLSPEAFTTENGEIYSQLIKDISENNTPIKIANKPSEDLERDAKGLADLFKKRLLTSELEPVLAALTKDIPAESILERLENSVSKVNQAIVEQRTGQLHSASECVADIFKLISEAYNRRQEKDHSPRGIPTGFKMFDYYLSGLQKGIHLLSAEPGKGKSTLALNIALNAAKFDYQCLFLSFEESIENLMTKALCSQTRIDLKKLTDGFIPPIAFKQKASGMSYLSNLYFLEGTPKTSIPQVKAKALQIMNRHKNDRLLIVVDYLQKWASMIPSNRDYRLVVSQLSGELRDLSKRLQSPLLAIVSQNRTERGQAKMSSMKESGDLEYDADSIWIITDNDNGSASKPARSLDLNIIKNRYGDQGKVPLLFQPQFGLFTEEARDY